MSEIFEESSTTTIVPDSTQGRVVPLSNFNFSIVVNFKIEADPSLVSAIEKVAACVDAIRSVKALSQNEEVPGIVEKIPVKVETPLPFIELPVKSETKTVGRKPGRIWTSVDNNLKYATDGSRIYINYAGNNVETTRKEVERLLSLSIEDRSIEVRSIIGENKNKRNTLYSFLKFYDAKLKHEDPDAAFRPMLTSYSTKPMGDCGKADDNLEG